ncbi:MAG: peptidoglycan DD-metalloendopeptidase family protein [Patescibacteria group bacterium]
MQFLSQIFSKKQTLKLSTSKEMAATAFFAILAIFITFSSPSTAHAGLFSFIEDWTADEASAKTLGASPAINSQNMALLQAPINSNPNASATVFDDPVVSGSAFVAEIGPAGTVAEVEERISTQISLYTVRDGDTLSGIAQMFGVSVNTILWANDLPKGSAIKNGQTLVILPITGIRYTVKRGDTIKGIVLKYKANLEEVLEYNDLTVSSTIVVGDVIVIPDAEPTAVPVSRLATSRQPATTAHDTNGPFYPGYYIRPITGGSKTQGLHGHNAIDIGAAIGTSIRASAEGTVISSISNGGYNGGYGNYVIISHDNGTQTLYAHNQKNFVKAGDRVEQGQLIAKVGNTGKSTGPHLHFEIRGAKNPF